MSTKIDIDEVEKHLVNAHTLGELIAFYRPESEPDSKDFGNIYANTGFMIMEEMSAAQRALILMPAAPDA
jgi:hypothetical protein